jgi:phage terminase small subunit
VAAGVDSGRAVGFELDCVIMALNDKQRRFVDEYLKSYNATQAAVAAGYSEKTAYSIGWENLRKPEIAEAIQKRLEESAMSAKEVLMRLAEQARVNIGDFFTLEPFDPEAESVEGQREKAESPEDEAARRMITEVFGEEVEVDGKRQILVLRLSYQKIKEMGHLIKSLTWTQYGPKLELHDGQAALLNIGKHHKLFTDRTEISGPGGGPINFTVDPVLKKIWEDVADNE